MEQWLESFAHAAFLRSADTAHDLKTPLNIAVLNLELLRMRVKKLTSDSDDRKLDEYSRALELELRRMAQIFDTFFLLSTPPKGEGAPPSIDAIAICRDVASSSGLRVVEETSGMVAAHEPRIRQAFRLFFDGAEKVIKPGSVRLDVEKNETGIIVRLSGESATPDHEVTKLFKFYYTDAEGNPDLSLAAARLIVETYGGGLNAIQESDKVTIWLSLPLGEE
ncbi:MAG: HAMP domain-containing histidine kinase [Thermoanaerobaculia bacterium]|nr:HAMP domain-containing histidine kinase [Thermoanaerobaculia bacterium]